MLDVGTVYSPPKCEPALCGFQSFYTKFAQSHPDDLDIVELEEPVTQFLQAINQADFLAYSAIFSEYGNGGGGKDYVADSHKQVKKSISLLREVIDNIQKQ